MNNILAIVLTNLPLIFLIFGNFQGIMDLTLYLTHGDRLSPFHPFFGEYFESAIFMVIRSATKDWTHNLQAVVH